MPASTSQATAPAPGMILFLGMVRRGEFESLQNRGLPLGILVDTNSKHRLADVSGFVVVERFDFSRPAAELVAAVREIQKRREIACLCNVIEFYVAQTAEVAVALGLPGISPRSAALCLDKSLMRARLEERIGPHAVARNHVVKGESDLLNFATQLGYPVFLQPANVSASMWSTRNLGQEALLSNYRAMLDEVPRYFDKIGKNGTAVTVVAAEYLPGGNTSVDCVADSIGYVYHTPVVDVLTGQDIGIDDYHHFARLVPSRLGAAEQRELQELAVAGVRALEMAFSAAHVEFIGPRLGEIAARPGGNRPRILELAYGIDELYAYYQILRGKIPDLRPSHALAAAIITPYAPRKGILRAIRHLDEIPALPGYLYHEVRGQMGQAVGLARDGYRAPLYIELRSANPDEIRRSVDRIAGWTDLYDLE